MEGAPTEFAGFPTGVRASGRVLVVPLLTVGNVPQLTVDLLVNSFALARTGIVVDESVVPMASSHVYSHTPHLSFACELFQLSPDVALLQLRSKVRAGRLALFCRHLAQFAAASGFAELLVLGSADAGWLVRPDEDRLSVRFAVAGGAGQEELRGLGLKPLEWESGEPGMREAVMGEKTLAGVMWQHALEAKLGVTELVLFCNEGENIHEAHLLSRVLLAYLEKRKLFAGTFTPLDLPSWKTMIADENPEVLRMLFQ